MKRGSLSNGLGVTLAILLNLGWPTLASRAADTPIDFSHCGYEASLQPLPHVPARWVVPRPPEDADATETLQAALDQVGMLPLDSRGFRGAVLLEKGTYCVEGQLIMNRSGVVLRGAGMDGEGTVLLATGPDRRSLIRVLGEGIRSGEAEAFSSQIADETVPVGAMRVTVGEVSGFTVGATVRVVRPSTREWIETLGMDRFLVGWRPGSRDVSWEREVTGMEGNRLTLDAPLTTALEARFGGGRVAVVTWPGRIGRVGIENLVLESEGQGESPRDEDHAWVGVTVENAKDAWIRRVRFRGFAGSAVMIWESARRVTVRDCLSLAPFSEIGGHRRRTYFTAGQQTLFFRCWSEEGLCDFGVGHCAAGPNAFVYCEAERALGDSGTLGSWASGVLYDNVKIDGASLRLENRWVRDHAAGWSAANSMVWQASAAEFHIYHPPTAENWARGIWGRAFGDGGFEDVDEFVTPASLFQEQLAARSADMAAALGRIGLKRRAATNPSLEETRAFVAESNEPAETLRAVIEREVSENPLPSDPGDVATWAAELANIKDHRDRGEDPEERRLRLAGGRLVMGGRLRVGGEMSVPWWRGNTRSAEAPAMGPALTRFVPGRVGLGFTDDLEEVAASMEASGAVALQHHHGLWYDRRRDDHLRVRRADGQVSAPFYEQPFARSGRGTAWDGLSLYDLEKPNPWYWARLRRFADLADRRGLVLYHQNYFQHAVLEAGAHWADSPWRAANNVNETGFPEPPPYAGDKRIFQAHLFYDVTHPVRRELHRRYIRQGLETFAEHTNVIQLTGAEFTGPLSFVEFWIDTVRAWESETGRDVLLGLSCTRDVQDAILSDPERAAAISIIDIRYWHRTAGGELHAPPGGRDLSPRQFVRQLKPEASSFGSIVEAVRECRHRYPDKAVVYHAGTVAPGSNDGWAVLMGGGSLPDLPPLPAALLRDLATMSPVDEPWPGRQDVWCLADEERGCLVHAPEAKLAEAAALRWVAGRAHQRHWIDPETGGAAANPQGVLWIQRVPR